MSRSRTSNANFSKTGFSKKYIDMIGESFDGAVKNGKFGAHMKIALQEDGPVTIWLDSKFAGLYLTSGRTERYSVRDENCRVKLDTSLSNNPTKATFNSLVSGVQ